MIYGNSNPRTSTSFLSKEESSSSEHEGERAELRMWDMFEKA